MNVLRDFIINQTKLFLENIVKDKKIWSKVNIEKELVHIISPGRVNIIGEHTDYNSGLAIPLSINKYKFFSGIKNNSRTIEIYDNFFKEHYTFSLENISYDTKIKWANYIKGVVKEFISCGYKISGFSMVIDSNLLSGSGLSSSAAILLGMAKLLDELFDLKIDRRKTLKICHSVENNFIGINNGILDHFAVLYGKKDNAIYIDFSNLDWEYIPFDLKDNLILVIDSKEERYLPETDYNKRREECLDSLNIIKNLTGKSALRSLSDVDPELLDDIKQKLPYELYKRTKHVVTENERVRKTKEFLKESDFKSIGSLLLESHRSLRNDYKVSTKRLDLIVDHISNLNGVYGARLMGAGFGGTVLSIVRKDKVDEVVDSLSEEYKNKFALEPIFIPCSSSDGVKKFLHNLIII